MLNATFKVYRSPDALLIRWDGGEIELPHAAALALADAIRAEIAPNVRAPYTRWTPARIAELRRLYVTEGQTSPYCAKALGASEKAIEQQVKKNGFARRRRTLQAA